MARSRPGATGTQQTPWRTQQQAAERLQCTDRHVRDLIANGELPASRFGRLVRIHLDDIDAFLRARRIRQGDPSAA